MPTGRAVPLLGLGALGAWTASIGTITTLWMRGDLYPLFALLFIVWPLAMGVSAVLAFAGIISGLLASSRGSATPVRRAGMIISVLVLAADVALLLFLAISVSV